MATAGLEQPPPIYQAIHTSMHVQKEVGMQIAADCMQIGLRPSFTPAIAASLRVGTTFTLPSDHVAAHGCTFDLQRAHRFARSSGLSSAHPIDVEE